MAAFSPTHSSCDWVLLIIQNSVQVTSPQRRTWGKELFSVFSQLLVSTHHLVLTLPVLMSTFPSTWYASLRLGRIFYLWELAQYWVQKGHQYTLWLQQDTSSAVLAQAAQEKGTLFPSVVIAIQCSWEEHLIIPPPLCQSHMNPDFYKTVIRSVITKTE